jgi:hypothetical protein
MTKLLKMKATELVLVAMILLLAFGTFSFAQGQRYKTHDAWSFGVMGDTQWTLGRPGYSPDVFGAGGTPGYTYSADENPDFISEAIAKQIRQAMIAHSVKFMFQMGDSSNWPSDASMETVAENVQDLYAEGIGYFPIRGNHETYGWMVGDFRDGEGNLISSFFKPYPPDMAFYSYDPLGEFTAPAFRASFPQTQGQGSYLFGTNNFSSPTSLIPFNLDLEYAGASYEANSDLVGLSYSFDYGPARSNARFVVFDWEQTEWDWSTAIPTAVYYGPTQQQAWISGRLNKDTRGTEHAFVFAHRQPMGANHKEAAYLFGSNDANPFFESLQNNDVKYYISGHDHLYKRSIVKSPDLQSHVTQIISQGASTKFYSPAALDEDQESREIALSEELDNVGYYIYTVDGPRVTVDYYSDEVGNLKSDYCWPDKTSGCSARPTVPTPFPTPTFNFVKKDSFGYSLNGKQFLVVHGESYNVVKDAFRGTTARILAGANNGGTDYTDRPFAKSVNTGWTGKPRGKGHDGLDSDILSLWGMADLGTEQTEVYVLSMGHDFRRDVHRGKDGIVALDADGDWVNAVDLNVGSSTKKFVYGPYKSTYGLGTYGIDPKTKSAWAVLDYNADFAIGDFSEKVPCHKGHGHKK